MKKLKSFLAILLLPLFSFALTPWGLPTWVDISTYALNDYSQWSSSTPNLKRSLSHKNRFIEQIQGKLNAKYPNIFSTVRHNRENSAATTNNFKNDDTNGSEFVFFSGHGSKDFLYFYNGGIYSGSGKKFGGYTRWAIFDACLALNKDIPISQLENWFDGAHAILGFSSLSYEFIHSYNCFFTCDHYRSEDQYDKFAARFIRDGETIWSAYNNAVKGAIYSNGGIAVEPAIVYRKGNVDNGQYVDFSEERLQNVYNGPFNSNNGASNILTDRKYTTYGTPAYY